MFCKPVRDTGGSVGWRQRRDRLGWLAMTAQPEIGMLPIVIDYDTKKVDQDQSRSNHESTTRAEVITIMIAYHNLRITISLRLSPDACAPAAALAHPTSSLSYPLSLVLLSSTLSCLLPLPIGQR